MKSGRKTIYMLAVLIVLAGVLLCACSKEVSVTVNDLGKKISVDTKTGLKISQVLLDANIKVATNDEVEPSLESELTEDVKDITIKRYAKVKVVADGIEKEVEVVGGKVEDALNKLGISITEKNYVDPALNDYLKDGMVINVYTDVKVSLTADGKTVDLKTKAATVGDLLTEAGIKLGSDDELTPTADTKLTDGMKIVVKRVEYKEEKKKEVIKFTTKKVKSDSLSLGSSELTKKGADGEKEVVYKIKYVDGKEEKREKVSEKVTKKAVDQVVTVGSGARNQSSAPDSDSNSSADNNSNNNYNNDYDDDYSGDNTPAPVATSAPIAEGTIGSPD